MQCKIHVVCEVLAMLFISSAHAQGTGELMIQYDGGGYGTLSNFRKGFVGDIPEVSFDVSIIRQPPCKNLAVWFVLQTSSGAYLNGPQGSWDGDLQSVQQGSSYVYRLAARELDGADLIHIWLQCSATWQ